MGNGKNAAERPRRSPGDFLAELDAIVDTVDTNGSEYSCVQTLPRHNQTHSDDKERVVANKPCLEFLEYLMISGGRVQSEDESHRLDCFN